MADMGLRSIVVKPSSENKAGPFCHCYCRQLRRHRDGDVVYVLSNRSPHNRTSSCACNCGEADCTTMEWSWDNEMEHPEARITGNKVLFHPIYSQGTSMIRGDTPLAKNHIHYWEIKIITCMSGTDLMLGIGTSDVDLISHQYRFASVLGLDEKSWGYSYRGQIQHEGRKKYYGKKFVKGCIIGVYLDLFKGHLEYYLNRRPQGIAYRNVPIDKDTVLYPLVCATSAKSSIKLINASSFRENLQFHCMKVIGRYPEMVNKIKEIPGLARLCNDLWFLQSKERYEYSEFQQNNLLLEDEAILCGVETKKFKFDDAGGEPGPSTLSHYFSDDDSNSSQPSSNSDVSLVSLEDFRFLL